MHEALIAVHDPGEVETERRVEDNSILGACHRRDGEGGRRDQAVVTSGGSGLDVVADRVVVTDRRCELLIFSIPTTYGSPTENVRPTND